MNINKALADVNYNRHAAGAGVPMASPMLEAEAVRFETAQEMRGKVAAESELQYAARVAGESLARLDRSVQEIASRLQIVLAADSPTAPGSDAPQPQRAVSSQIATALLAHSEQTDSINRVVQNLLRRIVL